MKIGGVANGTSGIRKVKGVVPHDLGTHDPWHEMNAYTHMMLANGKI
jgi:non-lysosomal glucosylceramidase